MWLEAIPNMAAEVAAPMSQCEKITIVTSGEEGDPGPAQITKEVMDVMVSIPEAVQNMTGVNLTKKANSGQVYK